MKESVHKNFDNFLGSPTPDKLYKFLTENFGEIGYKYDFKEGWQDCEKIAKHILGFSNSGGGGIIIGVKQDRKDNTFNLKGLDSIADHNKVDQRLKKYIPDKLKYEILNFSYDDTYKELAGKKFQVIIIKDLSAQIPFVTIFDGGTYVKKGTIYIRRLGGTEPATYEELQNIVDRRCTETSSSEFLEQLDDYRWKGVKKLTIDKNIYTQLEEFNVRLLSTTDRVVTIELIVPDAIRKKISFLSGFSILEGRYVIFVHDINQDRIELKYDRYIKETDKQKELRTKEDKIRTGFGTI